jgi:ribonuclease P protein component
MGLPISRPQTCVLRLRKRAEFLRAARGRKFAVPGLVLQQIAQEHRTDPETIRVGFTTTKKLGNAVVRNRIRRRLREASRALMAEKGQPGFDYVLIGRKATLTRSYCDLLDDLEKALQMISNPGSQNHNRKRPS